MGVRRPTGGSVQGQFISRDSPLQEQGDEAAGVLMVLAEKPENLSKSNLRRQICSTSRKHHVNIM